MDLLGRGMQLRGKGMRAPSALLLLFVSGFAAAVTWAQSPGPKANGRPFSLTITPLRTEIHTGEDVDVKIRVTNTSDQDIPARGIFINQGVDTSLHYDCRDAAGNSVTKGLQGGLGSGHEVSGLKPGESREENLPLGPACDLGRPGQYEIQISTSLPSDPKHRLVKSNTIKITVMP